MSGDPGRSSLAREARDLAANRHAGQERKATSMPYLEHVTEVAALLDRCGFDEQVVAAALLHDLVEHTDLGIGDVRERFGERVAAIVGAMTDRDEIEPWSARKAEHRRRIAAAGRDAAAVYAADKVCGVREARAGYAEAAEAVEERLGTPLDVRLASWEADLEMLGGFDPPLPLLEDLAREVEGLREDRAARVRG